MEPCIVPLLAPTHFRLRARCRFSGALHAMNPVILTSVTYVAAVAVCVLALLRKGNYEEWLKKIERSFSRLASRPLLATTVLFLSVLLLRVAALPLLQRIAKQEEAEFVCFSGVGTGKRGRAATRRRSTLRKRTVVASSGRLATARNSVRSS